MKGREASPSMKISSRKQSTVSKTSFKEKRGSPKTKVSSRKQSTVSKASFKEKRGSVKGKISSRKQSAISKTSLKEKTGTPKRAFSFLERMQSVLRSARKTVYQPETLPESSSKALSAPPDEKLQRRRSNKKKNVFKRKEFIKKLQKMEQTMADVEKSRQAITSNRAELYQTWDLIMERIVEAERTNCILKRKVQDTSMYNRNGHWEHLRRERNADLIQNNINHLELNKLNLEGISGGITEVNVESDRLSRDRLNLEKERIKEIQNMINAFATFKREGLEDRQDNLANFTQKMREKQKLLRTYWTTRIEDTISQMTQVLKIILTGEKQDKLNSTLKENFENLNNVVNVYMDIINRNFNTIDTLTRKLNDKMSYERQRKRQKEEIETKFNIFENRISAAHEKCYEMKRHVTSGDVVRAELTKVLKERKRLLYKYTLLAIEKESKEIQNEKVSERFSRAKESVHKEFFQGKRNYFKKVFSASELRHEQYLFYVIYSQTVYSRWGLKLSNPSPASDKLTIDFKLYDEGSAVKLTDPGPVPKIEQFEGELENAITVYDNLISSFERGLRRNCMSSGDLEFPKKRRKVFQTYQNVLNEEKKVFSIIENDISQSGRGT